MTAPETAAGGGTRRRARTPARVGQNVGGGRGDTLITSAAGRGLLSTETLARHGWPLAQAATVGCAVVGALILSRYPRHPIGWLLLATGSASQLSLVLESYSIWVHRHGGPGTDAACRPITNP